MRELLELLAKLSPAKRKLLAKTLSVAIGPAQRTDEPVAVVGMGCRYPGGASSPRGLWKLLHAGRDAMDDMGHRRWDTDAHFDRRPSTPGKTHTRTAALLDDVSGFDAELFGISDSEAVMTDPQQRLLLEVSWEALEDAGIAPLGLRGSPTGVFVGAMHNDYLNRLRQVPGYEKQLNQFTISGQLLGMASGRISYVLGLQGPSITLDTACSSSLVALHLGCQSLARGECELALVGGVNLMLMVDTFIMLCSMGETLAPDGYCKTFDAAADGLARSEGAGMVVLKPLSKAQQDGDRILAVVRGTAINNDGRGSSVTAPNGAAQQLVMRAALAAAQVAPQDVDYVEAHGTGTPLGDSIELGALSAVYGAGREADRHLVVGSIKTNLGHSESASGIAALIKVLLALDNEEIPPHLHLNALSPHIDLDAMPVAVPSRGIAWPRGAGKPRLAAINSFSFSGTNAHVIVEEGPPRESPEVDSDRPLHILTLSARSPAALDALARQHADDLAAGSPAGIADRCFTANVGRSHLEERLALLCSSLDEARSLLATAARGGTADEILAGSARQAPRVAFLFPGKREPVASVAPQLVEGLAPFRDALDACRRAAEPLAATRLDAILGDCRADADFVSEQIARFALGYGLAETLRAWGLEPHALLGRGVGEYAAACVAGVFDLDDALKLVAERARLLAELAPEGTRALEAAEDRHLEIPAAALGHFEALAASIEHRAPRQRLLSEVSAGAESDCFDHRHWALHMRGGASSSGGIARLRALGSDVVLSLGPALAGSSPEGLSCLEAGHDDWRTLLRCLAQLYVRGADIDWRAFDRDYPRSKCTLPTYPFQRRTYWFDERTAAPASGDSRRERPARPLLGRRLRSPELASVVFSAEYGADTLHWLEDHRAFGPVVLSATSHLVRLLAAARTMADAEAFTLSRVELSEALLLEEQRSREVQLLLSPEGEGWAAKIASAASDEDSPEWTSHLSATVTPAAGRGDGDPPPAEEELPDEAMEGAAFYGALHDRGLYLGASFQWLEKIWRLEDGLVATLRAARPEEQSDDAPIHPGWLDAALQLVAAGAPGDAAPQRSVLVPVAIEALHVQAPPAGVAWCRARLRSGGDAERVVGDVRVSDEAGRLLVEVVGLELRRVTPATLLRGADAGIRNWLYRIEWRPVPAPRTGSLASDGRWLVFTDRGELGLAAAELLRFHGARATLVAPGSDYERSSDDAVRFDMSRPELFDRLFRELDPVTGVLHLASLDHRVADGLPHREDAEAALLECRTLLHTVQAALRHRGASPRLWIVTRGARAVRADEPLPGLCQAPLWGFGAVLANEQPEIWGGMVDLDPAGAASEPADLLEVLTSEPSEPLTAFRGGERHRPSVVPLAIDMPPEPLTLRSDASYLITGGLGALGMRVAQWLVEAGARDLVLAGRRPPAAADAQRIAAWRDRGLLVEVAALDVADGPAVRALIAKLYQDGRPLAGVVHAAGVLRDRTLSRQSWDHFVAVTDPKIHGLVALLEGIGDARLDFFVCFSSISALLGNPGQVNYAAANAFLDACAHHLRAEGIRALSIGWGAWASMGMAARYGEHLWRHWGLSPMNGHQAVRALDALVRTDLPQCYVSPVDWVQFAARRPQAATGLFSEVAAPEDAAEASPPSDHALRLELAGSSAEERVALMLAHVRQVAMRLLRRDDIQVHERLEELGLDSLLQIDLVRALEQSTGLTLPTTLVFQYPTPYEIASYLSSEMESELARGEA